MIYIVMGVSGCGKSTVAAALARRLGLPFYDADDFHPPANKAKMSAGLGLDDADRAPWLKTLAEHITQWSAGSGAVLACSALKRRYRDALKPRAEEPRLRGDEAPDAGAQAPAVTFIFLDGPPALIQQRLADRPGHFMPPTLLDSQFADLEPPNEHPGDDAIRVNIDAPLPTVIDRILAALP